MKKIFSFVLLAILLIINAQCAFGQSDTTTPNHGLILPAIVHPEKDVWGQKYHDALIAIDDALPRNNVIEMMGATPSVVSGTNHFFRLTQSAPTVVNDFIAGAANQSITILVGDDNSTINFTTSALIRADGGGDIHVSTNNLLFCVHDNTATNWICNVISPIEAIEIGAINCTDCIDEGQLSPKTLTLENDDVTLSIADCDKTFTIATDGKAFTLPATIKGCELTFINAGADGNNIIKITPDAADQIFGSITLASSILKIATSAGESINNTKTTAKRGDSITLIGDGTDGWYIQRPTGIWGEDTP